MQRPKTPMHGEISYTCTVAGSIAGVDVLDYSQQTPATLFKKYSEVSRGSYLIFGTSKQAIRFVGGFDESPQTKSQTIFDRKDDNQHNHAAAPMRIANCFTCLRSKSMKRPGQRRNPAETTRYSTPSNSPKCDERSPIVIGRCFGGSLSTVSRRLKLEKSLKSQQTRFASSK